LQVARVESLHFSKPYNFKINNLANGTKGALLVVMDKLRNLIEDCNADAEAIVKILDLADKAEIKGDSEIVKCLLLDLKSRALSLASILQNGLE
jgi:hypothetical protein